MPDTQIENNLTIHQLARFMERVEIQPDECWMWTGSFAGDSRLASFYDAGHSLSAARWIYAYHYGAPPKHKTVRRTCATHGCVNPAHRRVGGDTSKKPRLGPRLNEQRRASSALQVVERSRLAYARRKARHGQRCEDCGDQVAKRGYKRCARCSSWNGGQGKRSSPEYLRNQHQNYLARKAYAQARKGAGK